MKINFKKANPFQVKSRMISAFTLILSCLFFSVTEALTQGQNYLSRCDQNQIFTPESPPKEIFQNALGNQVLPNLRRWKATQFTSDPSTETFLQAEELYFVPLTQTQIAPFQEIDLLSGKSCQQMDGFGFSLTESSVINFNRLPFKEKISALRALFDRDSGAGFNYLTIPLSSTDFNDASRGDFSVCDCQDTPENQSCFKSERLNETIELLQIAKHFNHELKLMLKPWTTPPFMKFPHSIPHTNPYFGGHFDPRWIERYSSCLADSVRFFKNKGFKVQSIAAQNEPGLSLPYPSVYMDDYDHGKLLNAIAKKIRSFSPKTQIIVRSDNFISAPGAKRSLEVLDPQIARPIFSAHCYSNDPQSSNQLLPKGENRFCSTKENKKLEYLMGECSATGVPNFTGDFNWWFKNRVINDIDQGASGIFGWNGILDENYGPKNHGCPSCRGLLTAQFNNKNALLVKNPEYYALAHVARFVKPNAMRIILDKNSLVFENPNGAKILVFHNDTSNPKYYSILTEDCQSLQVQLKAGTSASIVLEPTP